MSWIQEKGPQNDVVLSSRIRLARNMAGILFPSIMDEDTARKVIAEVRDSILLSDSVLRDKFNFIPMKDLPPLERYVLVEKHLASLDLVERSDVSALMLDQDGKISIMINEEDHIRMQSIYPGYQLDQAWEILNKVDDLLEERIEYAYDEHLGYLTCCPTNVGTGMRASIMMHLPALAASGNMNAIVQTMPQFGLTVRGLYGEGTEATGSIFQISNQVTLGRSEDEILNNLKVITDQIIQQERKAREMLKKVNTHEFEDKIWRAFGLLKYARKLDTKEFMSLISQVRMGISLDIISPLDMTLINELLISALPAHLQKHAGRELSQEDLDIIRADLVRQNIQQWGIS
jgi:protein arginine kinase